MPSSFRWQPPNCGSCGPQKVVHDWPPHPVFKVDFPRTYRNKKRLCRYINEYIYMFFHTSMYMYCINRFVDLFYLITFTLFPGIVPALTNFSGCLAGDESWWRYPGDLHHLGVTTSAYHRRTLTDHLLTHCFGRTRLSFLAIEWPQPLASRSTACS
jgi:hypothetical protein